MVRCSCRRLRLEFGFKQTGLELLLKPETLSFYVDRDGMMQQAIEDSTGDHRIAEHLAPGAKTLIAGDDDRAALVTARDQLEEQVGALAIDGR